MRPPNNRIALLIRLAIAAAAAAIACLPLAEDDPSASLWVHGALGAVTAVALLVTVVASQRLPRLLIDPAMTLAAFLFFGHAFYAVLSETYCERNNWAKALNVLMGVAAGLVATSQMMERQNAVRLERRAAGVSR